MRSRERKLEVLNGEILMLIAQIKKNSRKIMKLMTRNKMKMIRKKKNSTNSRKNKISRNPKLKLFRMKIGQMMKQKIKYKKMSCSSRKNRHSRKFSMTN